MPAKQVQFAIKGMQRDLSRSKFNPEFAYENMNIRITSGEKDDLFSITNEKGNIPINIVTPERVVATFTYTARIVDRFLYIDYNLSQPMPKNSYFRFWILEESTFGSMGFMIPEGSISGELSIDLDPTGSMPIPSLDTSNFIWIGWQDSTVDINMIYIEEGKTTNSISYRLVGESGDNNIFEVYFEYPTEGIVNLYIDPETSLTYTPRDIPVGTSVYTIEFPKAQGDELRIRTQFHFSNNYTYLVETQQQQPTSILGTVIGTTILNKYVIIFTHDSLLGIDRIYRLEYISPTEFIITTLFESPLSQGSLNFSTDNPIECIPYYENEEIQKVYFIDGRNQPRFINISLDLIEGADPDVYPLTNGNMLNFIPEIELKEHITINKNTSGSGIFPAGVIQYAFTYFNKYGQETNVFYTSPLHYISFSDRGGSPEDSISTSFTINIEDYDNSFDYIRIYSIIRTSIDAVPLVRAITEIPLDSNEPLVYIDTNTTGNIVDPNYLLYVGGEKIIPNTFTHKDQTLFLGNYEMDRSIIPQSIKDSLRRPNLDSENIFRYYNAGRLPWAGNDDIEYYRYDHQLEYSSNEITYMKSRETYRFGVQFQHKTGKWSDVVFIGDARNPLAPNMNENYAIVGSSVTRLWRMDFPEAIVNINDSNIISNLIGLDYVRARGVMVFPSVKERDVVTQGVLNPTLFNIQDRYDNSPYAISSSFFRPNLSVSINSHLSNFSTFIGSSTFRVPQTPENSLAAFVNNDGLGSQPNIHLQNINKGAWTEFRAFYLLPGNNTRNGEIQCLSLEPAGGGDAGAVPPNRNYLTNTAVNRNDPSWVSRNREYFVVDSNLVTLHSPEVLFDLGSFGSISQEDLKLRIVGLVELTSGISDIQLTANPSVRYPAHHIGFYEETIGTVGKIGDIRNPFGSRARITALNWEDYAVNSIDDSNNIKNLWAVYPWHRDGSLNNQDIPTGDETRYAILDQKKISNLRFSYITDFITPWNFDSKSTNFLSPVELFNSNEYNTIIKIDNKTYSGNFDKVLNVTRVHGDESNSTRKKGYRIYRGETIESDVANYGVSSLHDIFVSKLSSRPHPDKISLDDISYGVDPVRVQYKSTPHLVFALNTNSTASWSTPVLPTNVDRIASPPVSANGNGYVDQDALEVVTNRACGYLWLGELYRDNVENKFGGTSEEALTNNTWIPVTEPIELTDSSGGALPSITIAYRNADTYYQRYDCLKTYGDLDAKQTLTEILSFMCETRLNIDGRYDRNRGQKNNLTMNPTNFNLWNPVYSQTNNFFSQQYLNSREFSLNNFPSTLTWTLTKLNGAEIDNWTSITLASTLDLDGDKGPLQALERYNNNIFAFQDTGISEILFNSRTQMSTTEGVPVELANSGRVDGKRYISNTVGTNNKWSIIGTTGGIYFTDGLSRSIYNLSDGLTSLADKFGFDTWADSVLTNEMWEPVNFRNFRTHFDITEDDVYFINRDYCLVYSQKLGQFTSFMNYERTPYMFNVQGYFYSIKNNTLWLQNEGDYNSFFGEIKPFYTTIIANPEEPLDKIFNTFEYRADTFDEDTYLPDVTFNRLDVWNEYQTTSVDLIKSFGIPSSLKKKFKIWRVTIPRDEANGRDRIRNPWVFIKLSNTYPNTYRTELHDMIVHYFG